MAKIAIFHILPRLEYISQTIFDFIFGKNVKIQTHRRHVFTNLMFRLGVIKARVWSSIKKK